ncbi:MAG: class I SAM-dependent methyltransferase [Saprospiraceae bacterium]
MTNLYQDLASVYEAMYQTFIDYEEEYLFYANLLRKYAKQEVLEIACGTGNLANHFLQNGFDYQGLDYSPNMVEMAKKKAPVAEFLVGDMQGFTLKTPLGSILITARSISYMIENQQVINTVKSVHRNLKPQGIFCFDFIDANQFLPPMINGKTVIHEASHDNIDYLRESFWSLDLQHGMTFQWDSTYYRKEGEKRIALGKDDSVVRTFMVNEMQLFLELNGFEVKEMISRKTYAFPTYVVVAEKI